MPLRSYGFDQLEPIGVERAERPAPIVHVIEHAEFHAAPRRRTWPATPGRHAPARVGPRCRVLQLCAAVSLEAWMAGTSLALGLSLRPFAADAAGSVATVQRHSTFLIS